MTALHRVEKRYQKGLITAMLSLCLLLSTLVQAEHIHLSDHGASVECLLCQHSPVAAVSTITSPVADVNHLQGPVLPAISAIYTVSLRLPPARAPPEKY